MAFGKRSCRFLPFSRGGASVRIERDGTSLRSSFPWCPCGPGCRLSHPSPPCPCPARTMAGLGDWANFVLGKFFKNLSRFFFLVNILFFSGQTTENWLFLVKSTNIQARIRQCIAGGSNIQAADQIDLKWMVFENASTVKDKKLLFQYATMSYGWPCKVP